MDLADVPTVVSPPLLGRNGYPVPHRTGEMFPVNSAVMVNTTIVTEPRNLYTQRTRQGDHYIIGIP